MAYITLGSEDDTVSGCECSLCELKEDVKGLRKRVSKLEKDVTLGYCGWHGFWWENSGIVKVNESLRALLSHMKLDVQRVDSGIKIRKVKKSEK